MSQGNCEDIGSNPISSYMKIIYRVSMIHRTIPSSNEEIPVVGVGTWRGFDIGSSAVESASLCAVLETLMNSGASVVDTSPMYGRAEAVVGDLLADLNRRDEAFIATKVWTQGRQEGILAMEKSFRLLQTDVIDLMQIHNLVDWRTHLKTMRSWQRDGRFRYLGYTHYRPHAFSDLIECLRAEPVDFLQFCYSINEPDAEDQILPFCEANGIATIINLPFGGGDLLTRTSSKPLPDNAIELGCKSWAQYCLKYIIAHPGVTCVIPGTSNPAHLADLLAAADGPLPDPEMRNSMSFAFLNV